MPTPDIAALGKAYLIEAGKINALDAVLNSQLNGTPSLATVKRVYAGFAKDDQAWITWLRAQSWPSSMASDVQDLIKADSLTLVVDLQEAAASSIADAYSLQTEFGQEETRRAAAATVLRGDLGLPPVPIK